MILLDTLSISEWKQNENLWLRPEYMNYKSEKLAAYFCQLSCHFNYLYLCVYLLDQFCTHEILELVYFCHVKNTLNTFYAPYFLSIISFQTAIL